MSTRISSFAAGFTAAAISFAVAMSAQADSRDANSRTVIGPNVWLANGAAALTNGEWERGIQLTQMGLASTVSNEDRATALANLCAGYGGLKKFQRAIDFCDQSLAISDNNWRAWQNRAAANIGLGKIEESLHDVERGLQLNPNSEDLQKTLAIVREHEKLQQERVRHLLES